MNIVRFGHFELDHAAGELRLDGTALAMQPRVFKLLAFLVIHQQRVVDKDELLSAIWPGVVVTDASLQRAISLARSALRQGGYEDAIRTHARRGYRFCTDAIAAASDTPAPAGNTLVQAQDAAANRNWANAVEHFERADADAPLTAPALEAWANAALCAGRLLAAVAPLERAAAGYAAAGNAEAAARAILSLARVQLELREADVTKGCLRRAASLLEDVPAGAQHGYLSWMSARFALFEGDLTAALEHARRAVAIGKQLGNLDLETIGKLYIGVALQASGDTRQGLDLQSEAAATVVSSDVSPLIGGIVYCGLLSGYSNAGELQRAGQWTDSFTRWCERSKIQLFHGSCLLHRAEIFATRGELGRAQSEIVEGAEALRTSAPWAIGDAQRLLGDLHLARGEFEQAESAYRSAREHGWDPYPGYAMMLHYRGQSAAALRGLRRAVSATNWVSSERRGNFLAHIVIIAALSGDLPLAAAVMAELDAAPEAWSTGAVKAHVCRARGERLLAQGSGEEALSFFRLAVSTLTDLDACIDAAVARLRLAACLAQIGDGEAAEVELLAASKPLERAGARFYLETCMAEYKKLSATMRQTSARSGC